MASTNQAQKDKKYLFYPKFADFLCFFAQKTSKQEKNTLSIIRKVLWEILSLFFPFVNIFLPQNSCT